VVLEIAWRNKIIDFAFPYIIQYVRDLNTRVESVEKALPNKTKEGGKIYKRCRVRRSSFLL
jgi:hypothetical protein